jgi:hypothetical protein
VMSMWSVSPLSSCRPTDSATRRARGIRRRGHHRAAAAWRQHADTCHQQTTVGERAHGGFRTGDALPLLRGQHASMLRRSTSLVSGARTNYGGRRDRRTEATFMSTTGPSVSRRCSARRTKPSV